MSEKSDILNVVRNGAILELTLNRPKANAIDAETSRQMGEIFKAFNDDSQLRVAIITGAGERFFSAGWDLSAAAEGESFEADFGIGGFGGYSELKGLNKPVIAAVNGMAVGGGFELVLAADMVVAADHAEFFFGEVFAGVIPDAGSIKIPSLIPEPLAKEWLMTGKRISASELEQRGLVNYVVSSDILMAKARELAESIIEAAPLAVGAIKEIVREVRGLTYEQGFEYMRSGQSSLYTQMLNSDDAQEGPKAFSEKRKPIWTGK